jgi:hypothetical protein
MARPTASDPKTKTVTVMMIQMLPNTTSIAERFSATLYQSLLDSPGNEHNDYTQNRHRAGSGS